MTTQTYPSRDELLADAQRLDAELSVLGLYDDARRDLGHDFGNGQRYSELVRVRRERDIARRVATNLYEVSRSELDADRAQCVEAYRRILRSKLRRYDREGHLTATAHRALRAWAKVAVEIDAMSER